MAKKPCDRCKRMIDTEQGGYIKFDLRERYLCERCFAFFSEWISNCRSDGMDFDNGKRAS